MESFHQTPILPSNAPPWPDLDQASPDTRVLGEQCGNGQIGYIQSRPGEDYLDNVSDDSGNLASTCVQPGAGETCSLPSPLHPLNYPWLISNHVSSPSYQKIDPNSHRVFNHSRLDSTVTKKMKEKARLEREARKLAAGFSRCDGYIKYRNRQPKDKKTKEDVKWPDHIEDVFLRALCFYPPCGRSQARPRPGVKQMGRNELIADYIFVHTGESRTRKQVSSHIQVLKPFVLNEPTIMRALATTKGQTSAAKKLAGKKASTFYNSDNQLRSTISSQHNPYTLQTLLNLQPEGFHMYMRRVDSKEERPEDPSSTDESEILHTYSTTDNASPAECQIQNQVQLYEHYPELADLPVDRYRYGNFLALHVPLTLHTQRQLGNAELAISFLFNAPALSPNIGISSRTRLYKDGIPFSYDTNGSMKFGTDSTKVPFDECKGEAREFVKGTKAEKEWSMDVFDSDGKLQTERKVRYYVPFSSKFWADYLWRTALTEYAANDLEDPPLDLGQTEETRRDAVQAKRNGVSHALNSLTAVQEIVAVQEGMQPQIVLTVHFSFSHAANPSAATTAWQKLDVTKVFKDAMPQGSDSQSGSSQDSTVTEAYCSSGGVTTFSGYDYSNTYPNPESGETSLASPIELSNDGAGFGSSVNWLHNDILPVNTTSMPGLGEHLLPSHANTFDFGGGHINISLDDTQALHTTAPQASTPYPATLDLDIPTDPLLLQPSRGYDYVNLFSPATVGHSPNMAQTTYPQLADELAEIAVLPSTFDYQLSQAFAGATENSSFTRISHRKQGSFAVEHEQRGNEESFGQQTFGYRHQGFEDEQDSFGVQHSQDAFSAVLHHHGQDNGSFSVSQHDVFTPSQHHHHHHQTQQDAFSQQDSFSHQDNTSFLHSQDTSNNSSFLTQQTTHSQDGDITPGLHEQHGFESSLVVTAAANDAHDAHHDHDLGIRIDHQHNSSSQASPHSCPRCVDLRFCTCGVVGGGGAGF